MHPKRLIHYFLTLLCSALLCGGLTACGQKGPLTLPQEPPEVAEPEQQKINDDTIKSGEDSGLF